MKIFVSTPSAFGMDNQSNFELNASKEVSFSGVAQSKRCNVLPEKQFQYSFQI